MGNKILTGSTSLMPSIYIIIPVHNRKILTRYCLLSLHKQSYQKIKSIIIDDGSGDGTIGMIQNEFPNVIVLHGDGNLWWTGAINLGVKYVLKYATIDDYILTMNNDTVVNPDYLETLINCASKKPKSLIGSIVLDGEKSRIVEDGGVNINWFTAKFNFLSRSLDYEVIKNREHRVIPVDALSGRGTLIPVKVFHNIGLYDSKNLPHYGADYEFSHRAKMQGYRLFVNYKSVVLNKVCFKSIITDTKISKWSKFIRSLFSRHSAFCIRYRWKFAKLTCPRTLFPTFFIFDISRIIGGFILEQLKIK